MTIKAVFFDMGGTIQTFWHTRELRLKATPDLQKQLLLAGIDIHLSDEQLYEVVTSGLARYHRQAINTLDELPAAQVWSEYILAGYPVEPQRVAAAAEDLMFFIETRYYQREMRPEIPAVLQAIQAMGLKIGLISNVHSRGQVPANLEQYGIRQYFDPIVLSCEYGRRKPDPAIFHYAARMANTPASKCAYIGDRVSRDILGARRAGYGKAIQIRHDFDHGEDDLGAIPDAVIEHMTELVDTIQAELAAAPDKTRPAFSSPVRALLFDAGDILYFRPGRGKKLAAFLKELSLETGDDHTVEKQALSNQAFQGEISQDEYREAILRLYGVNRPELIARGKQILEEEDNDVHFFDGVAQTLAALKQRGYLLGIITDTANPVHVKLRWFEKGNFGNVWDSIISSQEMGVRKPHPDIYLAALQQLGLTAQEAIFVGHKASELEGARQVGMKTVAFNYDQNAEADCYIENFSELLDLSKRQSSTVV